MCNMGSKSPISSASSLLITSQLYSEGFVPNSWIGYRILSPDLQYGALRRRPLCCTRLRRSRSTAASIKTDAAPYVSHVPDYMILAYTHEIPPAAYMCSTVCENAVGDSTLGLHYAATENANETTTQEPATCVSAAFNLYSELAVDSVGYVAPFSRGQEAHALAATHVRDQLRRSIKKNFKGWDYITRPALSQIISEDVIGCLFRQHMPGWTDSEVAKRILGDSRQDIITHICTETIILLALCIFVGASMETFTKLLEGGTCDSSLPFSGGCPTGVDNVSFVHMLDIQWIFLPYDLFASPVQVVVPEELIIPLIFDQEKDLIGSGGYSDVFQVIMDDDRCSTSTNQVKTSVYALKRFKDESSSVERSFRREYSVLQELANMPHDHILLHMAAWSQDGIFYMIFPQAKCNLHTFMEQVEYPGMKAGNVVWFFQQLRGLAGALRHLHALKIFPALYQYREDRPMAESDQAVFHNDIKPENILVFDSKDGFPGTFKISDFGCGKLERKGQSTQQQSTQGFYGTPEYESPDVVRHKAASKPNDVWALGCVFLELLDWFSIPSTEKPMSFQSQRYTGPGPRDPAFWYRMPNSNKFQLKPQVGQKLMDLEKSCYGKRTLEGLLIVIWAMIDVDLEDRWTAERVYNDLAHLTRQAALDASKDPEHFLRPGRMAGSNHLWRAAFPQPSFGGGGSKIDGETEFKRNWCYHLNSQIHDINGDRPSGVDQRLKAYEAVKEAVKENNSPSCHNDQRGYSPLARKLQRVKEAGQLNP